MNGGWAKIEAGYPRTHETGNHKRLQIMSDIQNPYYDFEATIIFVVDTVTSQHKSRKVTRRTK